MDEWAPPESELGRLVIDESRRCLNAYREKPNLVEQDASIEISNVEGGYGRKQLHELIQNGADAMRGSGGRIAVVLTGSTLYCANGGEPFAAPGVGALMASHIGTKRDDQIGRFGLGFKSVLGISDATGSRQPLRLLPLRSVPKLEEDPRNRPRRQAHPSAPPCRTAEPG